MVMTPLTAAQQAAVDALAQSGRIAPVPVDLLRASSFMGNARDLLDELPKLTGPSARYTLAYDACHDAGEALLASYGFRTTNGPGQHEALGRYLCAVLDIPPSDAAARRYDQLRRSRNQQRYQAGPVGAAQANLAAQTAQELYDAARHRGIDA
ncbi:hypothetical protein [Demequina lutea]|uniref:HEPN domain-containing protein n=1 Tax=Demequina lutea TaxID=431489 RepID=A0A7Y9ZFU6_9MICO|nr:hypothetical protein [Demequina lutea]NYI42596.1 hypothetical protein [Demequina lutea]